MQMSIATNTGNQEKLKPEQDCKFWYLDELKQGHLKYNKCDYLKIDDFIIKSTEETKYGPTGWSKRYFGYAAELPIERMKDGSIINYAAITLILVNGKYSVLVVISDINPNTGIVNSSVANTYYNL